MTQVDRITEDIAHIPVAAFIFRDRESEKVNYSADIRYVTPYVCIHDIVQIMDYTTETTFVT